MRAALCSLVCRFLAASFDNETVLSTFVLLSLLLLIAEIQLAAAGRRCIIHSQRMISRHLLLSLLFLLEFEQAVDGTGSHTAVETAWCDSRSLEKGVIAADLHEVRLLFLGLNLLHLHLLLLLLLLKVMGYFAPAFLGTA